MNLNLSQISKLQDMKKHWNRFQENHPKFLRFLQAAEKSVEEGSLIEIRVTAPDGTSLETNLRLKEEDIEMIRDMQSMRDQGD